MLITELGLVMILSLFMHIRIERLDKSILTLVNPRVSQKPSTVDHKWTIIIN